MLSPIMDEVSQTILVEKINIDYEMDRARAANVMSVPTVILVENDQEVRRFVGAKSLQQIKDFING
jgi:thioredoxin 1